MKQMISFAFMVLVLSIPVAFADNGFHGKNVETAGNFLRLKIQTNGITSDQQTVIDFVLALMENGPAKIKIETGGIKINARGSIDNNSAETIENALNTLNGTAGKMELKIKNGEIKVREKYDEHEDGRFNRTFGNWSWNNTFFWNCTDNGRHDRDDDNEIDDDDNGMIRNIEKHLYKAKEAREKGKYGKAFGQTNAAFNIAKRCRPIPPMPPGNNTNSTNNQTNTTADATVANGTIHGTVFNDSNNNSIMDVNETGLAGWTVLLNGNVTVITNANGTYSFMNLTAGTYIVSEIIQTNWTATTENQTVDINQTTAEVNFGNQMEVSS